MGKKIVHVGDDLESIIEDNGYWLPSAQKRYCTKYAKIKPMERWLGKDVCKIYYGIRSDENRPGYENASGRLIPVFPLVEESINLEGVYDIILKHDLKPPTFFWQSVFDEVARVTGGADFLKSILKPWQLDVLFSWRTRANCYFCFNQRYYEWVGLLEHYPELFWNAEKYEHLGSGKLYTWNNHGTSLAHIAAHKDYYKRKRIKAIVKVINGIKQNKLIFDDTEKGFKDMLAVTSCGLFCGK